MEAAGDGKGVVETGDDDEGGDGKAQIASDKASAVVRKGRRINDKEDQRNLKQGGGPE